MQMNEKKRRIMEWWNGGVQQVVACTFLSGSGCVLTLNAGKSQRVAATFYSVVLQAVVFFNKWGFRPFCRVNGAL